MALLAADLRRMLDDAWDAAPDGDGTLRAQLRTFERAADFGATITGTSGSGQSSSLVQSGEGIGTATNREICIGWRTLIDLFDAVTVSLTDAGLPTTDDAVYAAMKAADDLQTIRSTRSDFTLLRFPTYGPSR